MTSKQQPRRFAPLAEGSSSENALPKLKGIVFDVDGTLCEPQTYMFKLMRDGVGVPPGEDILEYIYTLTDSEQEVAMSKIRAIEREAMSSQTAQPGLVKLMDYIDSKSIPKGICTRNFDAPVAHLLEKFLPASHFHPIVTRDFRPPKPAPDGILHIAASMGFVKDQEGQKKGDADQFIMVGDSIDDMTAGYRAGAATVLLVNPVNAHLAEHEHTDLCISRLDELIGVLEKGFVGRIKADEEGDELRERAEIVLKQGKGESSN
ncbi:HAD-like protein [Coleophoma cylindrospora]|uniref:HAD-like protein n=1 Tax=Coleophoma cylindrospora TaxID=1849047 RepID=A0A3D8QGK6_9HELO|nr:HAD-like protein [Coleophoma cylindrospora]